MNKEFVSNNRKKLMRDIEDDSVILIFAGKAPYKSADETYAFTPNRNFYYLTGIDEEEIILLMTKKDNIFNECLYIKRPDEIMARWMGPTISEEENTKLTGIKNIKYLDEFYEDFATLLNRVEFSNIYLDLERRQWNESFTEAHIFAKNIRNKYPYLNIKNIYNKICKLRTIKTNEEIKLIKTAIDITKDGIYNMMKNIKPGMMEYEVEAYFDFILKKNGVKDFAFPSILASGENATVLHYDNNNCKTKNGDLLLCDLGAQYKYYNGDISRTFPVSGRFTERQKDIYKVVLEANNVISENAKPGVSFSELENVTKKVLAGGCKTLGLIKNESELQEYYFHSFGHYLGSDTHDVGSYKENLKEGMIITDEPGLYIKEEGIGIRIEDDLLITKYGCEILSNDIIKSIEDIENFMK
ncbi:aminopeptidase P family protein [Clostridium niameyense]|uniref:Xaa-Pro aminopeptidase n=1 Tax=Clostridium niameyense TaxID=1622073 RepID=A0A6M0RBD6_9CLOT|nr:aminopeptidase P family protein [Clostridium niameyense]NEZ47533.1 aminopeptidase P family protein [Clostridium niameyense]